MILNVAGMRAPFGAGGEVRADPGAGFGVVVVLVDAVVTVVVVLVEAGFVVACEIARVVVDDVLAAPPHPASRRTASSPRTFSRRFTLPA
jgi:hypothetical protein